MKKKLILFLMPVYLQCAPKNISSRLSDEVGVYRCVTLKLIGDVPPYSGIVSTWAAFEAKRNKEALDTLYRLYLSDHDTAGIAEKTYYDTYYHIDTNSGLIGRKLNAKGPKKQLDSFKVSNCNR